MKPRTPEEDPRYARLGARALARGAADDTHASSLPDRPAAVDAIERALRARGRRRFAPWILSAVAAAAAVVFVAGWWNLRAGNTVAADGRLPGNAARAPGLAVAAASGAGVSIEAAAGARAASRGDRIAAGELVRVAGEGQLLLALDTGTRLRLGASSATRVASLGAMQRFELESGTLEAEVAKLPMGGRFVIATADAEVEVKGTRFEVAVAPERSSCAPFVRTQVVVHEGVVAVRHGGGEVRLPAGSVWPACPQAATPSPAPASPVAAAPRHTRPARAPALPVAAVAAPPRSDPSTLAAQNDLFAAALAARRRGENTDAIRWLDRLLVRYPDGPLSESARAERRRLADAGGGKEPSE
jgi:ferric-dicitrate binding protein FerR (iron transport regulator)